MIVIDPAVWVALSLMVVLAVVEMIVPVVAERRDGGTPWHAHHIAERYALLVIITLGEVILGTVLAISAVVELQGWSVEAILITFGGMLLAFTLWWSYFVLPSARILHRHRDRAFAWGYLHMALFGSIAAVGAGLHVAAYVISGEAHVDETFALWTVAVPVILFVVVLATLYGRLVRSFDMLHLGMLVGAVAIVGLALAASAAGASLGVAIVILAFAPAVIVVGYEAGGYRKAERDLERLGA